MGYILLFMRGAANILFCSRLHPIFSVSTTAPCSFHGSSPLRWRPCVSSPWSFHLHGRLPELGSCLLCYACAVPSLSLSARSLLQARPPSCFFLPALGFALPSRISLRAAVAPAPSAGAPISCFLPCRARPLFAPMACPPAWSPCFSLSLRARAQPLLPARHGAQHPAFCAPTPCSQPARTLAALL